MAQPMTEVKTEVKTEEETKVEKGLQFFDDFDDKWFWDAPLDIEQGGEYTIDDTEPPSPDAFVYKEEPEGDVEHRTGEHQPWSVRASHRGKSTDLSPEELNAVRAEQRSAEMCGMKWHERGPRGDGLGPRPTRLANGHTNSVLKPPPSTRLTIRFDNLRRTKSLARVGFAVQSDSNN